MFSVVLKSVGLPLEGLAILAGVDRIREMLSAALNVLGDAVVAVYVAGKEGELDEQQYYHEELVEARGVRLADRLDRTRHCLPRVRQWRRECLAAGGEVRRTVGDGPTGGQRCLHRRRGRLFRARMPDAGRISDTGAVEIG